MRYLGFLLALLIGQSVQGAFFRLDCLKGWEEFQLGKARERAEQEARNRKIPPQHTAEFVERRVRLAFLERSKEKAVERATEVTALLVTYNDLLIEHPSKDKQALWQKALQLRGIMKPREIEERARALVNATLPLDYTMNSPPEFLARADAIAVQEANLAIYRYEVSRALAELPLDKPMSQFSEQVVAKAAESADWNFKQEKLGRNAGIFEEFFALLEVKAPGAQSALNGLIMRKAQLLIESPNVPPDFRAEVLLHVEFLKKHGLIANDPFQVYVMALSDMYLN